MGVISGYIRGILGYASLRMFRWTPSPQKSLSSHACVVAVREARKLEHQRPQTRKEEKLRKTYDFHVPSFGLSCPVQGLEASWPR